MREPVYLIKSHAGLKVYAGGQQVGLIPHDQVAHLLVTAAEQLSRRPTEYDPDPTPPAGLLDRVREARARETAVYAPDTTGTIQVLREIQELLEGS